MLLRSKISQQGIDRDGLIMLGFSILLMLGTAVLSLLWFSYRCYLTATMATTNMCHDTNLLVLGKKLKHNQPDTHFSQRLSRVITIRRQGYMGNIFILGGITREGSVSEAQAGKDYLLIRQPAFTHKLILEQDSRNTLENLKQARSYLLQQQHSLTITLLSNRYHLERSRVIAQALGFSVLPLAAEDSYLWTLENCLKLLQEGFLLQWYQTGFFISRLLSNSRMLNKLTGS